MIEPTFHQGEKANIIHQPSRLGDDIIIPVTIVEVLNGSYKVDSEHQKGVLVKEKQLRKIIN